MEIASQIKTQLAPNSKETEMMVLGCMLTVEENLKLCAEELEDFDFYHIENQIVFHSLRKLHVQNRPADIHLVSEDLKKKDKLNEVGGIAYLTTLAQYAGTSAYVEEYISDLKNKSLLRKLISESFNIGKHALDEPESALLLIEKLQATLKTLEQKHSKKIQPLPITHRFDQLNTLMNKHRGKKYLGLCVKTIEEFNEKLLGLRKLNLLAAAPNVGKTALTIQLAIEALLVQEDACLAYFSLEMTSLEIFTRMNLYLSGLNFNTLVFGSQNSLSDSQEAFFTKEEFNNINKASQTLEQIGSRLQIIDLSMCPQIDAKTVINYVENLKKTTKCSRAIVIIDYLQVWPINSTIRFPSENEADKWRIGEMKKIRDSMNDDPVIVISEARKPSGKDDTWGGDLSDVMGSARGTYTPDVVMLLSQLKPKNLSELWKKNRMPEISLDDELEGTENDKTGLSIKKFLIQQGIALCRLEVPKARDGMQKFDIILEFHFNKNIFKKINWENLREIHRNVIGKGRFD